MGHLIINCRDETEWLKERGKGIGGSDAAAILGLNPYVSNVDLWRIKTGRTKQKDISNKPCVKFGKIAEHHLRELFILDYPEYKMAHSSYDIHVHSEYDFIRASLDGELLDRNNTKGIWEAKTTEIRRSQDWGKWDKKIPMNYFCQILHYFIVDTDYKFAIVKARIKHTQDNVVNATIRHYPIKREDHESDIQYLFEKEIEFYWHIKNDKEPALILPPI